jgi:hypothetical protein
VSLSTTMGPGVSIDPARVKVTDGAGASA